MYATCLHCHSRLGTNTEIEVFSVGKRLAFDAAQGRLWVVCPSCKRWNLSPIEERWEAVECAERLYRETKTRVATDHVGLAVRRSGLELVRIGAPLRPEFAAWRYGAQLRSRFRRAWLERGISAVREEDGTTVAALLAFDPALILLGAPLLLADAVRTAYRGGRHVRGVVVNNKPVDVRVRHLPRLALSTDRDARWQLWVPHESGFSVAKGDDVMPLIRRLLPHLNDVGASAHQVSQAVAKVEYFADAAALLDFALRSKDRGSLPLPKMLGYEQRLALEMMTQEESERRAMDGELAALQQAWQDAERIAAIADGLLVPERIRQRLRRD